MEQKILERLNKVANDINDLGKRRETLISELRRIDADMEVLSAIVFELKDLLKPTESDS